MTDEEMVRSLVERAGFRLTPAELARLVALYPMVQGAAALVRSVDVGRDGAGATHFDPAPVFVDWG